MRRGAGPALRRGLANTLAGEQAAWTFVCAFGTMAAVANGSTLHLALGAALGAFAWTATEYASHRWVLHGPFGKVRLARVSLGGLHRTHHREPLATCLHYRIAGHVAVAVASAVVSLGLHAVMPVAVARSSAAAFSLGYSTYEVNHWNAHHRPARTQWGARLRERHHRHHFGAPGSNLGVTIGFWDQVFGTEAPVAA